MIKKFFSGLVLVSTSFVPGIASAFEYFVVNQQVDVYTQPNSSSTMAKLRAGEVLLEIDKQGEWSKVFFLTKEKQPLKGWMQSRYLTAQGQSGSGSAEESVPYYKATVGNLRLRQGAGTNHAVVGRLEKGQMVKILTSSGDWSKVKYKDRAGNTGQAWTATRFLKSMSAESVNGAVKNVPSQPVTASSQLAQVTGSEVNFRAGPGSGYRVLGQLSKPLKVEVLQNKAGWQQIRTEVNGSLVTGWMVNQFLKPVN